MKIFKYILIFTVMLILPAGILAQTENKKDTATDTVIVLNKAGFLEKIYNYEKNTEAWVYEGNLPCIIDFYADWCGPCKKVAPVLKELADEYKGQIIVYKIDVDKEKELAGAFGISSIPTFLFIPKKGTPQSAMGALPRESFVKVIKEFLLKENEDTAQTTDK
ncbi:MAG TPA: thioredoxin [Porphyromonadaceae bacterium]|nr:thioredoxin [Porphyromonadaceae bacterium]